MCALIKFVVCDPWNPSGVVTHSTFNSNLHINSKLVKWAHDKVGMSAHLIKNELNFPMMEKEELKLNARKSYINDKKVCRHLATIIRKWD